MIDFSNDQQAMIDGWLQTEAKQVADLDSAVALVQTELIQVQLEDSIYAAEETRAISMQLSYLSSKQAQLEAVNPDPDHDGVDNDRTIEFLPTHPASGGDDITAWQIYYMTLNDLLQEVKVIEYSHTVIGWDNDPNILFEEHVWNVFNDWRVNIQYGTQPRLSGLNSTVGSLTAEKNAILARNAILRDNANLPVPSQPPGAHTIEIMRKGVVDVTDLGAVPGDQNAASANTEAIQEAIDSLPASGGTVLFPPGIFWTDNVLNAGNGSDLARSTKQGIRLIGSGWSPFSDEAATVIRRIGGGNASVLRVNGPITGVEIAYMNLDANSVALMALEAYAMRGCTVHHVGIDNYINHGLHLMTRLGGNPDDGSFNCSYRDMQITSHFPTATGIYLHGDPAHVLDVTCLLFDNIQISYNGNAGSYGIYLRFTDGNLFNNMHIFAEVADLLVADGGGPGIFFQGGDFVGFPGSNVFVNVNISRGGVAASGTIGQNCFLGLDDSNGAPIPSYSGLYGFTKSGAKFGGF